MKSKLIKITLVSLVAILTTVSLSSTWAYSSDGESASFMAINETISIPPGLTSVVAIRDMDGDGILDIVLFNHDTFILSILERSGSSFITRFSFHTGNRDSHNAVADLDGDGKPEVVTSSQAWPGKVWVHEAIGDNLYALTYHYTVGMYPEGVVVGDSDGDGSLEFLVSRETFPSRVYRFEAAADNTYTQLPTLTGLGGDCYLAGTYDLDGDGTPETVFSDNYCYMPMGPCIGGYSRYVGRVYVYENGALVYEDPLKLMLSVSLGDTDGNGLGEIIGRDKHYSSGTSAYSGTVSDKMRILESTGSNNEFVEVFYASSDYSLYVIDVDNDGVSEFWRSIDIGNGQKDVLTLAHRSGSTITDYYNSGSLFQGFAGNIQKILAIGDTNGDGNLELAVQQGNQIHILSAISGPENQLPNPPIKSELKQFKSDGTTQIDVGDTTDEDTVVFRGKVSDPDGDKVKLEIELRRLGEYGGQFLNEPTPETISNLVDSGSEVTITRGYLVDGDYHWQARAVDEHGNKSDWVGFRSNDILATDFSVKIGIAQLIQQKEINRVRVTVDGQEYYIVTISCYIDPETLECVSDSGLTKVYVDKEWNPVSLPWIAEKIAAIDYVNQLQKEGILQKEYLLAKIGEFPHKVSEIAEYIESKAWMRAGVSIGVLSVSLPSTLKKALLKFLIGETAKKIAEDRLFNGMKLLIEQIKDDFMKTQGNYISIYETLQNDNFRNIIDYKGDDVQYDKAIQLFEGYKSAKEKEKMTNFLWNKIYNLEIGSDTSERIGIALLDTLTAHGSEHILASILKKKLLNMAREGEFSVTLPRETIFYTLELAGFFGVDYEPSLWVHYCSPGELRVYDSEENVTGLVNGEIREEIPNSKYNEESKTVIIFSPSNINSYRYEVVGTDEGTYDLTVTSIEDGEATTFTATDIPTTAGEVHQYSVDWDMLSQGEEGTTLKIDLDGDGDFDEIITAGNELNMGEPRLETQIAITEMIYGGVDILNGVTNDVGDGVAPLLLSELKESTVDLEDYTPEGRINPGQKKKLKMKFKFLETAGNEYQDKSINVKFKFLATQEEQ